MPTYSRCSIGASSSSRGVGVEAPSVVYDTGTFTGAEAPLLTTSLTTRPIIAAGPSQALSLIAGLVTPGTGRSKSPRDRFLKYASIRSCHSAWQSGQRYAVDQSADSLP